MAKRNLLLSFFLMGVSIHVFSQNLLPKQFVSVGFGFAKVDRFQVGSNPIVYNHSIPGVSGLRYLVGVRQNLGFGQQEYTINKQKVVIDDLSNYSLNLMVGLEYVSAKKVSIGFNLDLLGGTFGTRSYKTVGKDPIYYITPEHVNLLKGGENSTGSLNSEFYLGYMLTPNLTLKGGVSYYGAALNYKSQKLENRAITGSVMPFVQIQYMLWSKN